jgi:PAS domain S-box-containing protein
MTTNALGKLLLVEDNSGDARLLSEMLKEHGPTTIVLLHVQSIKEAAESLAGHAVDVVLLDLGLPDAFGLEAVRRARAIAPHTALVVLTGLDDEALASQALQQGAQDYLIKGQTDARGLLRALRYAVERKAMEDALFGEKERAQVTLNCIGDGVACTDISGNLTFINLVAQNLTGWSWHEAAGRPMKDVFRILDGSRGKASLHPLETVQGCGKTVRAQSHSVLIRRDGFEIPIEESVASIQDRDGRPTGAVIILRDVSASRAMGQKMVDSATDLAKQNALLNRANGELAAIVRSSPIAIYATDPAGLVTMWSPAAERLSGFSQQHAIGAFLPIVPEPAIECFKDRVRRVSEGEVASNVEFTGRKKDGTAIELSIFMGPLTDEDGVARGAISLAENVTEAVAARKKVAQMQSDFVSTVSHELRTPLTSIGGSLGLIVGGAAGAINDRATRLLQIANSNTQRLIRLVNDILDIEKLQSGQMAFRFANIYLDEILEQVVAANLAFAATFKIEIRLSSTQRGVVIWADADRITQAITNLLSNAVKFSPAGAHIEIGVTSTVRGARLSVRDHGPGISDEFRSRIFERFAQADTSDGRKKGGSGLGLSIVRQIMERHGGSVSFQNTLDIGTTFHLDFPSLREEEPSALERGSEVSTNRILVCAGSAAIAEPMCAALRAHGLKSASTLSQGEGILEAVNGVVDALVIDASFAQGTIGDFVRRFRVRANDAKLPVVYLHGDRAFGNSGHVEQVRTFVQWVVGFTEAELSSGIDANFPRVSQLAKPAILHVEATRTVVESVRIALEDYFRVVVAPTVERARQCLARETFELVILDIKLSVGLAAGKSPFAAGVAKRVIPIFVLTDWDAVSICAPGIGTTLARTTSSASKFADDVESFFNDRAQRNHHSEEAQHVAQGALCR